MKQTLTEKSRYIQNMADWVGGIAQAKDNWSFLTPHTNRQLVDFYHVTEYLGKVAYAAFPQKTGKPKRGKWLSDRCHQLKHEPGTTEKLIQEMEVLKQRKGLSKAVKEELTQALTYYQSSASNGVSRTYGSSITDWLRRY